MMNLFIFASFLIFTHSANVKYRLDVDDVDHFMNSLQKRVDEIDLKVEQSLHALKAENDKWISSEHHFPVKLHEEPLQVNPSDGLNNNTTSKVARICQEYFDQDPSLPSGNYVIDPDGIGGQPSFQVYCEMSLGTTALSHDSEAITEVRKCQDRGCYNRTVSYSANRKQIEAVKALSYGCRQKIQIDCISVPLYFNEIHYSWWHDFHGQPQYYWSGNDDRNHVCACHYSNNCVEPDVQCNCDAYFPELFSDIGYITNKHQLPVTELYFGRNHFTYSQASHTLGKLECYGKKATGTTPSSCLDLWITGHFLNGFYTIYKNNIYQVVYCDMDKLPDEEMESYQGIMDIPFQKGIYFRAHRSTPVTGPARITYDQIDSVGCRFSDGMFLADKSGFYSFSFLAHTIHNNTKVDMVVNGSKPIGASISSNIINTLSIDSTVYLNINDTVAILVIGTIDSNGHAWMDFSGGLLEN